MQLGLMIKNTTVKSAHGVYDDNGTVIRGQVDCPRNGLAVDADNLHRVCQFCKTEESGLN